MTLAAALLISGYILGRWWAVSYRFIPGTGTLVQLVSVQGAIDLSIIRLPGRSLVGAIPTGLKLTKLTSPSSVPWRWWFSSDAVASGPVSMRSYRAPGWLVVLPVAALAAGSWLRRRRQPGACSECGYDIRGVRDGRCPECGNAQTDR